MQRFAKQRNLSDCVRCSLATLLSIPYRSVPDFYRGFRKQETQTKAIEKWLAKRGLAMVRIPASRKPDCLYLAAGEGYRGFWHMVVMRQGKLVHDPHRDGTGIRRAQMAWLVVPQDIGER